MCFHLGNRYLNLAVCWMMDAWRDKQQKDFRYHFRNRDGSALFIIQREKEQKKKTTTTIIGE